MKSFISLLILNIFLLSSCKINQPNVQKTSTINNYPLVHIVYFKTKENADIPSLIQEIKKLERISVLHHLEVGTFKDLNDSRAMAEFEVFIQMRFANEADYKTYQNHPQHIELKNNARLYLTGPPVTYDYLKFVDQ